MSSRICSKDLLDKEVLGRQGKEVVLLKKMKVFLMMGGVSKDFKTGVEDGGRRCTSDDIGRAVWNVEEGIVFNIFEGRPDKLGGWGTWDRSNG